MTKDKAYQVMVYRTVQQSVEVTVYSDRDIDELQPLWQELELEDLRREAEDLAGDFSDYEWKNEEVDQMFASEIKAEE
tara:strand:- start:598 stop:831 length:234 start_codon:yes stop_codon:yes gene_type:complete